jgi:hypothetical protein
MKKIILILVLGFSLFDSIYAQGDLVDSSFVQESSVVTPY